MNVLQCGFDKSGNLWLWRIIEELQRAAGIERRSFLATQPIHSLAPSWDMPFKEAASLDALDLRYGRYYWAIPLVHQMPIHDLESYARACSHVWTQLYAQDAPGDPFAHFDRFIYIIRDPRDVIVSLSRWNFTPHRLRYFDMGASGPAEWMAARLEAKTRQWCRHVAGYLELSKRLSFHAVFYENLIADPVNEIRRIAEYIGAPSDDGSLTRVLENTSFERMKEVDPSHVRTGVAGGWADAMSKKQNSKVVSLAGPLLAVLGYPKEPSREAGARAFRVTLPNPADSRAWRRYLKLPGER